MFPHFVIAGAAKCGTSSLHAWLDQHPGITMSTVSEPGFFTGEWPNVPDLASYRRTFFPGLSGGLAGEATPYTLFHPEAAGRLAECNPEAKIIVSVRPHPDAIYSWYWHQKRCFLESRSFEEVIEDEIRSMRSQAWADRPVTKERDYFRRYTYVPQVERFERIFGAENVFVFDFSERRQAFGLLMDELCSFLGLERYDGFRFDRINAAKRHRGALTKVVLGVKRGLQRMPMRGLVPGPLRKHVLKGLVGVAYAPMDYPKLSQGMREVIEGIFADDWAGVKERCRLGSLDR
jgi:hypothetical protein